MRVAPLISLKCHPRLGVLAAVVAVLIAAREPAMAAYPAVEVVSYTPGNGTSPTLRSPGAALGLPGPTVPGSFGYPASNFNPFTPHWSGDHIVQVGFGGGITLRLERFVTVSPAAPELGVWENVFLVQQGAPGTATDPAVAAGADTCAVEVSADGLSFVPAGTFTFNRFGNYWVDSPGPTAAGGTVLADFGAPFTGALAGFDGLAYADVLAQLAGTGGGTWLDLDAAGLSQVGWVRFTGVASGQTLELDAVAINSALAGPTTAPEPSVALLLLVGGGVFLHAQRRLHAG